MGNGESKHDKFKRLATQRVANAIKKIEIIGNLSSSGYEYGADEVEKIFSAIQETAENAKKRFSKAKPAGTEFSL